MNKELEEMMRQDHIDWLHAGQLTDNLFDKLGMKISKYTWSKWCKHNAAFERMIKKGII